MIDSTSAEYDGMMEDNKMLCFTEDVHVLQKAPASSDCGSLAQPCNNISVVINKNRLPCHARVILHGEYIVEQSINITGPTDLSFTSFTGASFLGRNAKVI